MSDRLGWVETALEGLRAEGRLRATRALAPRSPVRVDLEGRSLVLFSSNDYLGLSGHPEVRRAAARAARELGMGPRGAALVCGHTDDHAALEAELARLKGTEAALLFPTGYQANLAALSTLAGPGTTVFSDELCHASIIDGCQLSRAPVEVYRHRDLEDLEALLSACRTPRRLIVTDTVFSMEGTQAPLAELVALKRRHRALLVVDEAHATLVHGPHGGGLAEAAGVAAEVDVQVGTLSKAFGAHGGFVATSRQLERWLVNRARTIVFTTALPAPVVAAARAALRVATRDGELRDRLWARVRQLADALDRRLESPIVPLVIGDNREALRASRRLLEAGFHVPAIRPPSVPAGTARLRVTLSAAHAEEEVAALAEAVRSLVPGD